MNNTKVVILAGGFGTRISEETVNIPKPMVRIGGMPILWHILKMYSYHGFDNFIICLGYKAEVIKKFFVDYSYLTSDFEVNLRDNSVDIINNRSENWRVTLVDTGRDTLTGGRIKRIAEHLTPGETFLMTYGDGVSDVNIRETYEFHKSHGKLATVTAVTPPGRFGVLDIENSNEVVGFREKIASDQYRINAGFFALNYEVLDYIEGDNCTWEQEPMIKLAADSQLRSWTHDGFWMPMDTLRDKNELDRLVQRGEAPWKTW